MNCPRCNSCFIEETSEFDMTYIFHDECQHDFVCLMCGCLFSIVFQAFKTKVIGQSEIYPLEHENESSSK